MHKENYSLLKYLSFGVLYDIQCEYEGHTYILEAVNCYNEVQLAGQYFTVPFYDVKPYLRPMSSMTDEESNELESITFPLMEKDWDGNENPACIRWIDIPKYMDFIFSNHFDYQGLIEKGLALEVTKDNNPYEMS